MSFASLLFLFLFLPAGVLLYAVTPRRWKLYSLFLLSLFFYGQMGMFYFAFMLASVTVDYLLSRLMQLFDDNNSRRRTILGVGLVKNLGIAIIAGTGYELTANVVPAGLYIYLFSALGYLIDVYRGDAVYEKNYIRFALYCIMFPRIHGGPMLEYNAYLAQLKEASFSLDQLSRGFSLFILGFAKQILIMPGLREITQALYALPTGEMSVLSAWLMVGCTALSYYYAFSSWGDMAEGLGIIFGFRYRSGYNYPLISESVSSFLKRFNGSVTAFIRRFVTIQLSADTTGGVTQATHLLVSTVLVGMWYSANLNGILWGLFLGVIVVLEECIPSRFLQWIPLFFRRIFTLILLLPSFLLLTCGSGAQFLGYLKILVGIGVPFGGLESGYITGAYWLSLAEALLFALPVLRPVRRLLFPAAGRREANAAASPSTLLLRTLALLLTAAILFYSIILML